MASNLSLFFYSLLTHWAFLVAQLVRNLLAMWGTWVQSLGWEDPLKKGTATHSSILALENSMGCIVHGVPKSHTRLTDFDFHCFPPIHSLIHLFIQKYSLSTNYVQSIVTEYKQNPSADICLLLCLFPNADASVRPKVPQQQGLYFFLLNILFQASSSIPGT